MTLILADVGWEIDVVNHAATSEGETSVGLDPRVALEVIAEPLRDLAPAIHRQRLVIEGVRSVAVTAEEIRRYLTQLSEVCGMRPLIPPVTHRSERYGWAGWIHWETSGAHFYAWDEPEPFFSVDVYACKAFDNETAVVFTRDFFDATEIVARAY